MKLRHLFLAAIVALGMMACNNEDTPQVDGAQSTVSIKVLPSSNGAGVRATGNLSGNGVLETGLAAESAINQLEVFIFAGESPDGYKSETGTNVTEVKQITTHSGPKTIVVVANGGIGAVASKADLIAKTKHLPVNMTTGLVMTSAETPVTLVAGQNYYGYAAGQTPTGTEHSVAAPLKITRVNARVAIVDAKLDTTLPTDQLAIFDALTNAEVAIFNVPKTTKLFGTSLAMNANYLFGEAWPTTANSYMQVADGAAIETSFKDATVTFPIENTLAPYYYVNENTSTVAKEQMLIVLRAKPTKGGNAVVSEGLYTDADGYTYYPVWVNAAKNGYAYDTGYTADSKILRNTQYNITLLIKGIGNPTIDEVEEAFLDVLVAVEDWKVVNQNVTWE